MALLNLYIKDKVTCDFGGQSFEVTPYITPQQKEKILKQIYDIYEEEKKLDIPYALFMTQLYANFDVLIVLAVTDVELSAIDYNLLVCSGFLDIVKSAVVNYEDVRHTMMSMIQLKAMSDQIPDTGNLAKIATNFLKTLGKLDNKSQENLRLVIEASLANSMTAIKPKKENPSKKPRNAKKETKQKS